MIAFARIGRIFPFILNPYDFLRFAIGNAAGVRGKESEIVYTRRQPDATTSSEIFTMSEGESDQFTYESNALSTLLHTAEQI